MRGLQNDRAVSPLIGFIIATVLFTASFYYVIDTAVDRDADTTRAEGANFSELAGSLAQLLLEPGAGWYSAAACTDGKPNTAAFDAEGVGELDASDEPVGRFGLGDDACGGSRSSAGSVNNISFDKLSNLYGALLERDGANTHVDYAEAKTSLGLDARNMDFHLRSWPVLFSTQEVLRTGSKDPNMRPLYVGNYEDTGDGGGPDPVPPVLTGISNFADKIIVYVNVTNDGVTDTVFGVSYALRLKGGTPDVTAHTPLLAAGDPDPVGRTQLTIPKTSGWEWKDAAEVEYSVTDRDREVASGTIAVPWSMTSASTRPLLFIESGGLFYDASGGAVTTTTYFNGYDGKGKDVTVAENQWRFLLKDPDGTVVEDYDIPSAKSGSRAVSLAAAGLYDAELWTDDLATLWNADAVVVLDGEALAYDSIAPGQYTPASSTIEETRFIDLLIEKFDREVIVSELSYPGDPPPVDAIPFAAGGDVYPADKHWLNEKLRDVLWPGGTPSLSQYTTVMVGSDIDQTVMNSAHVKKTIEDWVDVGGTLVVFGTTDAQTNWLRGTLIKVKGDTAGASAFAPDEDHPVLNVPNNLDYDAYIAHTKWDIENDGFTPVVVDSGSGLPILSLSEPGALGGSVVLAGWRPSQLTSDQAEQCPPDMTETTTCQGLFLIHNLIVMTYRELYLDYGPPIPTGAANGVQTRIISVYHPELAELVTVHLQVFTFEG